MIRYHARWVLPISTPPIRDGWVAVDRGRIVAVGPDGSGQPQADGPFTERALEGDDRDAGSVALMPGLVNAHTHLELSYLRDAVAPASEFVTWVRDLIAARSRGPGADAPQVVEAIDRGLEEVLSSGTALVGDISNTLVTFDLLSRSALAAVVFYELIQFSTPDPASLVEQACRRIESLVPTGTVRPSLAAHAPYSVGPSVLRAIRQAADRRLLTPCSIHLSESAAEVDFIESAEGPWRTLLEDLGAWDPAWVAPGVSPVQYLDETGFLDDRVLAVHGVQMSPADLARLASRGATLVTCPRSNGYTGAGAPPLDAFYASGVRVAVGTDSLASTPDLNMFAELAAMRALSPSVPAANLLDSATRQGARALGFESDYGSLEPGRRARLLAVEVPTDADDVEEYLVSGVEPDQVRWIDA